MSGVVEPVRPKHGISALERYRANQLQKQAEEFDKRKHNYSKQTQNVVKKAIQEEQRKVKQATKREFFSARSDINIAHNDRTALFAEIEQESNATDKWGATIDRMVLKPIQKSWLGNTVIMSSERTDAATKVTLGCSEFILAELQPIKKDVEKAMSAVSGRKIDVNLILVTELELTRTPINLRNQILYRRQQECINALEQDSMLQLFMSHFDCRLEPNNVVPNPYKMPKVTQANEVK